MNTTFCSECLFYDSTFAMRIQPFTNTNPHSQNLFSHFASTRLHISTAHITQMCKWAPRLQRLQSLDKVEKFVDYLNRCGCSDAQITRIMIKQPTLISVSVERLESKIRLLEGFGFQGEILTKILTVNPRILCISLENDLLPKMEFLKNLFQSQEFLIKSLIRAPIILNFNLEKTLKPSVAFWERSGFKGTDLVGLVRVDPIILRCTSLTPAQADLIHEIGANKNINAYKYVVSIVALSRLETLKAKIENLKLCGLSVEETWQLCRARHQVLEYSKARISETMNFVVKDMALPANYLVKRSHLFDKNVEKVIRPRFLVWQKIKSTNCPSLSLYTLLTMTEARFLRNIIRAHPESTTLLMMYENAIANASKQAKSSIQS